MVLSILVSLFQLVSFRSSNASDRAIAGGIISNTTKKQLETIILA